MYLTVLINSQFAIFTEGSPTRAYSIRLVPFTVKMRISEIINNEFENKTLNNKI